METGLGVRKHSDIYIKHIAHTIPKLGNIMEKLNKLQQIFRARIN